MLYRLTLNSHKSLLSRYTAGYIRDNNKHRICSKVNIDKYITLLNSQVRLNGIFCALLDSSQPVITMLFEYSGSIVQHLTWISLVMLGTCMVYPSFSWMTTYHNVTSTLTHFMEFTEEYLTLLDLCPYIGMRLFLVTWQLGQDDKITLILYTNVPIFKKR